MTIDTTKWSGEGEFTQRLLDALTPIEDIAAIRVDDAPATRSDAGYNFISNEVFVLFRRESRREPVKRFGFLPASRTRTQPAMTLHDLEAVLTGLPDIGGPDYADAAMLQYLRTERIVPPYQTRGYK